MLLSIRIVREKGYQTRMPYSEELEDGIFELRAKVGSDISRVLYFFVCRSKDHTYQWLYKENTKNSEVRDRTCQKIQS